MSGEDRHSRPLDELVEDYLARRRRGESPSIDEYAAAHGEFAEEIRDLFPTLELVEHSAARIGENATPPRFPGLEILDEKAAGGMGEVYRARDVALQRIVAVKTTRHDFDTESGRAYFEREARAAARLDHPHIVRVYSFHPDHQPPYYVMPFVEGRPLRDACRGRDPVFVAAILEKIARALCYAHDSGIVHRDIKPANILVDHDHEPHITDFGLAKNLDAVLHAPVDGELGGTPHYIAPEVWTDPRTASPASDLYALGVTMYVLLTGRHPFEGTDLAALRGSVGAEDPPLPVEIDPSVPEPLQRICLVALERDPTKRYESARVMADDLRRFLEGREVFARPTRYLRERRGKLHNHLTDIRLWRQQNLIDTREMDRMVCPYHVLLESDSAWDELSRRFPWETALLRLGGWLALVSSVLWPAFYWGELVRWQKVAALGVPCLLINFAGWMYHHRGSRVNAVVFLSTGSLLLPMLIAVVLAEYGGLRYPQAVDWELFGASALEVGRNEFALTNAQINVTVGAFFGYALILVATIRAKLFGLWTGAGAYLSFTAVFLLFGLVYWHAHDRIALAALCYLPMCLVFVPLAGLLRRRGQAGWAALFYSFFPIPFALALTMVARFSGEEWLGSPGEWDDEAVQLWLMANGLLYLAIGLKHARSAAGFARFWGELFMLLVPVSLLVPANVMFEEPPFLGEAGGRGIGVYSYAAVLISVLLVVFGTRIRRAALVAPGAIGLAIAVSRITDLHFQHNLAWPLVLAIGGGLAMVGGAVLTFLRGRKKQARETP